MIIRQVLSACFSLHQCSLASKSHELAHAVFDDPILLQKVKDLMRNGGLSFEDACLRVVRLP